MANTMTFSELFKKLAYQIGTLGFVGVIVGGLSAWWSIVRADGDIAIATEISNLMIVLAVLMPLAFAGLSYTEREIILKTPRITVAIVLSIIGLLSGLFAVAIYFFIGFQVPAQFAGADSLVMFEILVPVLFSTGLIVAVITTIAGALLGFTMGAPATDS